MPSDTGNGGHLAFKLGRSLGLPKILAAAISADPVRGRTAVAVPLATPAARFSGI